jgi:hypothetical protein
MSAILRYYGSNSPDDRGRTLAETQAMDASRMEYYHDFIQWLFPLRQASQYNAGAPVLTDADVHEFLTRPDLRENLRRSFDAFLRFLGLEFHDGAVRESGPVRPKVFEIPNHNWLRITRVLLCLKTLGLDDECRAFFAYLKGVYEGGAGVTAETFAFWSDAARGVAR